MLKAIKDFFDTRIVADTAGPDPEHGYRLATAALLTEMTRADHEVKASERDVVTDALVRAFDLTGQETAELMALAEREAESATDLYGFTSLIRDRFSLEQKEHVVELMWRVAYADCELALLYLARGEDEKARPLLDRALPKLRATLGDRNSLVVEASQAIAARTGARKDK